MKNIVITTPKLSDIPTLWKWGEENWELWGDEKYKWFSKKSLGLWLTDPKDDVLLVAKIGKKLIGMCMNQVNRDSAFNIGFFVEKGYRSQGVGKKLIDESIKRLRQKGVGFLMLLVDTKNNKARKFYNREGFYQGFKFFMMSKELKGKND